MDGNNTSRRKAMKVLGASAVGGVGLGNLSSVSASEGSIESTTTVGEKQGDLEEIVGRYREGSGSIVTYGGGHRLYAENLYYDDGGGETIYTFVLEGNHEAPDAVGDFGFSYTYSDNVTPDPISDPAGTDNVRSGRSEDSDDFDPVDDREDDWLELAELLVGLGSFKVKALSKAGVLHTIVNLADLGPSNGSDEVTFSTGWGHEDTTCWGYWGFQCHVPHDESGWIRFRPETDWRGGLVEDDPFSLRFDLDYHLGGGGCTNTDYVC